MKRLVISLSITLAVSMVIVGIFASNGIGSYRVRRPTKPTGRIDTDERYDDLLYPNRQSAYGSTVRTQRTGPDPLADPNKIKAELKKYAGMEKALYELDRKSQTELREWLQTTTDNKPKMSKYVHDQVIAELFFLRQIAVKEGAKQTVAAIDGISLDRLERFTKLIKEMEKAKRTNFETGEGRTIRSRTGGRYRGTTSPRRYNDQNYQEARRRIVR